MHTNYAGSKERIRAGGGSVRVSCVSNVGQGNGGTSLPCAGCWVQAGTENTEVVKMNIGVAASAILGIEVARTREWADSAAAAQPMWIPIDDASKLYFYSADADAIIDITYLTD